MAKLDEIRTKVVALQATRQKAVDALMALRKQCRHPENQIVRDPMKVVCKCGEELWSVIPRLHGILAVEFSETELQDPGSLRKRFEQQYEEAKTAQHALQKECLHPDGEEVFTGMGDPFEKECGICRKDWYEIQCERKNTSVTS